MWPTNIWFITHYTTIKSSLCPVSNLIMQLHGCIDEYWWLIWTAEVANGHITSMISRKNGRYFGYSCTGAPPHPFIRFHWVVVPLLESFMIVWKTWAVITSCTRSWWLSTLPRGIGYLFGQYHEYLTSTSSTEKLYVSKYVVLVPYIQHMVKLNKCSSSILAPSVI